ncbi:MAG: hypothetical protein M1839_006496 [Geoglossum umbratile]|nr:MAG: hypothetical protein M1839_006496 [Geoglossum umbratile]
MGASTKEVEERDEAGNLTATYIQSQSGAGRRVDVVLPKNPYSRWTKLINSLASRHLSTTRAVIVIEQTVRPGAYELIGLIWESSSSRYQIYDSLQAFSSSIAGLLSSRAVLQGVGVGDATASPTAALLLNVVQESVGRLATILFAHKLGNSLVAECKRYRLLADIFNDAAIIIDCLSPIFPKPIRVVFLSVSSVSRAICGVAAGSSKTSLSAHFAKWGNLGELNAKDASQETVISLLGMLVGSVVVSKATSTLATWSSLILLLSIHLFANYKAVRAVRMLTLNRQRANIVLSTLIEQGKVLSPEQASKQERVFEWGGVLRWRASEITGHAQIGVKLQLLLASVAGSITVTGSIHNPIIDWEELTEVYLNEEFLLWVDARERRVLIVLKEGCTTMFQLKAWTLALMVTRRLKREKMPTSDPQGVLSLLREALDEVSGSFDGFLRQLAAAGWDVRSSALETRPGFRINAPVGQGKEYNKSKWARSREAKIGDLL